MSGAASFAWSSALWALAAVLVVAGLTWMVSVVRRDVSIVDSLWGPMIALAVWTFFAGSGAPAGAAAVLTLLLTSVWALRLAGFITWRNQGQGEDRRYQEIRRRNQPGFAFKSLYLVFALQAVLAWIVALPLMAAVGGGEPLGWLGVAGLLIWAFGIGYESLADLQLARFRADPRSAGRVLDRGLWRYSRHPNYFGEWLLWWGAWLVALEQSGAWTVLSPLLMTLLLLRISGVALLERDIGDRRPEYAEYIHRTNRFLPGPPRSGASSRESR